MDSGQVNGTLFPEEIPFEAEYEKAKLAAENFTVGKAGSFRSSISIACRNTYEGERSVDGFVKYATALIKDEQGHFNIPLLSIQTLFLNSLKSADIDLEVIREMKEKNPEMVPEYNSQSQNLIKMINGLVVITSLSFFCLFLLSYNDYDFFFGN